MQLAVPLLMELAVLPVVQLPSYIKSGGVWAELPPLWDVFIGKIGGCIGEISALAHS